MKLKSLLCLNKTSNRPQSPVLSPEEKQETLRQYKNLSSSRKKIVQQCLQHPCPYCEQEFEVPNVGMSHGICRRHAIQMWKSMGKDLPANFKSKSIDLKDMTPEEIQLAVKLCSIIKSKSKRF
jgi:hypothetical protein